MEWLFQGVHCLYRNNVGIMYELRFRYTLGRIVIMIAEKGTDLQNALTVKELF